MSIDLYCRFGPTEQDVRRLISQLDTVHGTALVYGQIMDKYSLPDVPRKRLQIAVAHALDYGETVVCDICNNEIGGDRLSIYNVSTRYRPPLADFRLIKDVDEGDDDLGRWWLFASWEGGSFVRSYSPIRTLIVPGSEQNILMWHWRNFYSVPIPEQDALALSNEFVHILTVDSITKLNEANRVASRMLYRLARQLGWRKLSTREQKKKGIDVPWVRQDTMHNHSGSGEFSIRAANGDRRYVGDSPGGDSVE